MTTESQARSLADRLNRLSRQSGTTYQNIVTQFLIERALIRLTNDEFLFEHLIFKGGYVGLRIYHSPRATTDLDAVLHGAERDEIILRAKSALQSSLEDHVWFEFESETELLLQNDYGGKRLQYRAGLNPRPKDPKKAQILHFDFGIGDLVTPEPCLESTPTLLGEATFRWKVYPVETVCSEKIHTLIVRGANNSRSKDVYDLAFLLPKCDVSVLGEALARTFSYRDTPLPPSLHAALITLDLKLLESGWKKAVVAIGQKADFRETFEVVLQFFRNNSI